MPRDGEPLLLGPYRLDLGERRLTRDGAELRLGGRAFDVLAALASAAGVTLSKGELLDTVWPGTIVGENTLQVQISALRKLLGEDWIVTIPGRGYRLVAPARPTLPRPSEVPSLVVLPFANIGEGRGQEYFADGIVGEITTALSRIGGLFVISRSSAFTYKGRAVDVRTVGEELGVRYVIEGSVRQDAGKVRIACQLIDAASASHLWAERFDGLLTDVFDLQDRIAGRIAGAIEPTLRRAEISRALVKPTLSLDAYDCYLRALHRFDHLTPENLREAVRFIRRAIDIDPDFAVAKAGFGWLIGAMWDIGLLCHESQEICEAVRLAREAIANTQDDPTVLRFAGHVIAKLGLDIPAGRAALDRALMLNPNSAQVLASSAWVRIYAGDWAGAREEFDRAMRLGPRDPQLVYAFMGKSIALAELGDLAQAQALMRQSMALGRGRAYGRTQLIYLLVSAGEIDAARSEARALLADDPSFTIADAAIRHLCFTPAYRERRLAAYRAAGLPE